MFVLHEYSDGSKSYGYETGDKVVVTRPLQMRDLYGSVYKSYMPGDKATITARCGMCLRMIPGLLDFYQLDGHLTNTVTSYNFEPEDPSLCRPVPEEFVVPWREGAMQKYSLIAARTPEEAIQIAFSAAHFTADRLTKIDMGEVVRKPGWELPKGETWISIRPLR